MTTKLSIRVFGINYKYVIYVSYSLNHVDHSVQNNHESLQISKKQYYHITREWKNYIVCKYYLDSQS